MMANRHYTLDVLLDLEIARASIIDTFDDIGAYFKNSKLFDAEGSCWNTGDWKTDDCDDGCTCFKAKCPDGSYLTYMTAATDYELPGV
jgi:hypothetical protein